MMPKVFIIIVNYNGWQDTQECLNSLTKLDYDNFEVVVIDNASTDNSAEILDKFFKENENLKEKLHISSFNLQVNLGFAGGNNIGLKHALKQGADYILLLNNDTIIEPRFLKELIRVGESNNKVGILGPIIYFYSQPDKIWFAGGKTNWLKTRGYHLKSLSSPVSGFQNVDYITGCCLLIKRQVIEKIGLMSEDYFLYYEDVDWCLKAKKAGYQSVLAPQAKIWHKISRSTTEGSSSYIYYHTRNGLILAWCQGHILTRFLVILFGIWLLLKQFIKIIIGYKKNWAKAIIKGIEDFYRHKTGPYNDLIS